MELKFVEAICNGCGTVAKVNLEKPCLLCKSHDFHVYDENVGTLITSYYDKFKEGKFDDFKGVVITISRYIPDDFDANGKLLIIDKDLAPSEFLLSLYKGGKISWNRYKEMYEEEYNDRKIEYIRSFLDKGLDVLLLCYCYSDTYCHRSIVSKKFKDLKYKTKEISY